MVHGICHKPSRNNLLKRSFLKEGITASLYMPHLTYTLLNRPLYSYARWRSDYRNRITARLAQTLSPRSYTLFCALFLGMKQSQNKEYKELHAYCAYWGILHYLSRSGLHALLITGVLSSFLRYVPLHFFLKELLMAFCIIIYHSLTWPSIPFTRAFITFLLYKLFAFRRISYKALHILSTSC